MTVTYGFDAEPVVRVLPNGSEFALVHRRVYTAKNGDHWTIPAGFRTDFATIPAFVAWAVAKLGAYTLAAIVHDLLCVGLHLWHRALDAVGHGAAVVRGTLDTLHIVYPDGTSVPRPTANAVDTDRIFYRICRDHGVDRVTASLLWVGVRWGALGSAARRGGFAQDLVPFLLLSLAFAPVIAPAALLVLVSRGVLRLARWVTP